MFFVSVCICAVESVISFCTNSVKFISTDGSDGWLVMCSTFVTMNIMLFKSFSLSIPFYLFYFLFLPQPIYLAFDCQQKCCSFSTFFKKKKRKFECITSKTHLFRDCIMKHNDIQSFFFSTMVTKFEYEMLFKIRNMFL